MFLRFIKEHPENPLTKLAYFQMGKMASKHEKYDEALQWFDKVEADALNGRDNTEYLFRKGYAYYATNDYKNAQLLFSEVKGRRSPFTDDAVYYFAYIAYLNKDYHLALVNFQRLKNSKKYESSYPYYITAVYFLDTRYDDVIKYAVPIINSTHQQNETEMLRIIARPISQNLITPMQPNITVVLRMRTSAAHKTPRIATKWATLITRWATMLRQPPSSKNYSSKMTSTARTGIIRWVTFS